MTDEPTDPDRPSNLHEPIDADTDHGAHGRFDDKARESSPQLWAVTHPKQVGYALASAVVIVLSVALGRWLTDE